MLDLGHIKYIISQNGDGLHPLSGVPTDRLSELHGNVFKEYCEKCCKVYFRPYYTLDDTASSYYEKIQDDGSTSIKKPKYATQCDKCKLTHRTGRRCEMKGCNGYLIDSIINFGDNLEDEILDRAIEEAKKSDLCLSLGTTMQVTPACDLVTMGKKPLKLVICNRQKTALDYICDDTDKDGRPLGSRIFGDCDPFMRELMKNMMLLKECKEWEAGRDSRMTQYDQQR